MTEQQFRQDYYCELEILNDSFTDAYLCYFFIYIYTVIGYLSSKSLLIHQHNAISKILISWHKLSFQELPI